jgi:protein-S-isoprenylcysteine O-methyltransferase Ste14
VRVKEFFWFRYRGWLGLVFFIPAIAGVVFSRPTVADDTLPDYFMTVMGWLCFMLYLTFRIWATMYIGSRKDKHLQDQGPYSISRNPLYLGSFCFGLATAFCLQSLLLLVVVTVVAVIYLRWIIPVEEKVLLGVFGRRFHDYICRTPRIVSTMRSYAAGDTVVVNLKAMKLEARRLWLSGLWPLGADVLMHLRGTSWWPCLFNMP